MVRVAVLVKFRYRYKHVLTNMPSNLVNYFVSTKIRRRSMEIECWLIPIHILFIDTKFLFHKHGSDHPHPHPRLKLRRGGGVNFDYLSRRGGIRKIKKNKSRNGAGARFLKGWRGGLALFLFNFFKFLSFLHLGITLPFAELCDAFEEKLFFSATIILRKKVILRCLKVNLKN